MPSLSHPMLRRLLPKVFIGAGIQYFVVQVVVGLMFTPMYSLANNTISDLGNTACGLFNGRDVCSVLHAWMNLSFVLLGLGMMAGAYWLYVTAGQKRGARIGLGLFGIGGIGVMMVGVFPENTILPLHVLGAFMPFLLGNIGLVLAAIWLQASSSLRLYTGLTGLVALLALVAYITHHYLGLGEGGMERLVAYPQTLWMIIAPALVAKRPIFAPHKLGTR